MSKLLRSNDCIFLLYANIKLIFVILLVTRYDKLLKVVKFSNASVKDTSENKYLLSCAPIIAPTCGAYITISFPVPFAITYPFRPLLSGISHSLVTVDGDASGNFANEMLLTVFLFTPAPVNQF